MFVTFKAHTSLIQYTANELPSRKIYVYPVMLFANEVMLCQLRQMNFKGTDNSCDFSVTSR